jgi:hypothetical protein
MSPSDNPDFKAWYGTIRSNCQRLIEAAVDGDPHGKELDELDDYDFAAVAVMLARLSVPPGALDACEEHGVGFVVFNAEAEPVAIDEAPAEVRLIGQLVACAANRDYETAHALAMASEASVFANALECLATMAAQAYLADRAAQAARWN